MMGGMDMSALVQAIAVAALPVILAITLHEAAHGYAARHFGDPTAWMQGRITLNPLKHIDPVGTVALPLVLFAIGSPFVFGWAKPVPVNFGNLRNPKRDMLWVAAAGPAANLAMALFWGAVLKLAWLLPLNYFSVPMAEMAKFGIVANVVLMVLNLFPLPPLDGGRIAVSLLPHRLRGNLRRSSASASRSCLSCCLPVSLAKYCSRSWLSLPLSLKRFSSYQSKASPPIDHVR
jgi:Zn-dependent protease